MKQQILESLRNASTVVSGEALSAELGISRVSVWKHVRKLQSLDYDIISTSKGYQLVRSPDVPFPWEIPGRASKIHYYPEVTSTMDVAMALARDGCPDFTIVVAGRQTKGRGRLQRTWQSGEGGLFFTVVIRPDIPPALGSKINLAAAVDLATTLRRMFTIDVKVKWPNDILTQERKLAGILLQMEAEADRITFMNIGIGLNVNNHPVAEVPSAVSIKEILGQAVSRKKILSEFLDQFETRMKRKTLNDVIDQWKRLNATLHRRVKIITTSEQIEGMAEDIDNSGGLILRLDNGRTRTVIFGDCFHQ